MATVSIGALRYDIIADTSDFRKGLMLSKKELRAGERVLRKNETAQERYQRELAKTKQMLEKGSISVRTHNREVKRLTTTYRSAHTVGGKFAAGLKSRIGILFAVGSAAAAARSGYRHLMEDMAETDALQKASLAMGETAQNIQAIQYAAQQTASFTDAQTINAIEKMTKRIAEAAQGMGEASSALKLLRVDARKLVNLRPYQQFLVIADAMEKVEDAGTRAALSQKLFDMEAKRIAITMRGGAKAIEEYRIQAEKMNLLLDEESIDNMVRANDAVGRMEKAWDRISKQISGSAAPGIEFIADKMEDAAEAASVIKGELPNDPQLKRRGGSMLKEGFKGFLTDGPAGFGKGIARGYVERSVQKAMPDWMRRAGGEKQADINQDRKEDQDSLIDTFSGWLFNDATTKRKFKLLKPADPLAKDADGSGADSDALGIQSLVGGTTAEQDSIEEYRFLVEKQQRENQALLVEGNTKALIDNTNALLNTTDREGATRPMRTPSEDMRPRDLSI